MVCCPKHSSITHVSQKTGKRLKHAACASNKSGRRVKSLKRCAGRAAGRRSGVCCPKGATLGNHNPMTGHKYKHPMCISKRGKAVKRLKHCK